MMYSNKLVASLKANGKVLREFKDTVYIPFGSEYSILIKNLNTVRACVNVFLDGEDVVPGGLVVDPGREIDLERWIKNGNLSEGNRFKFIERTAAIEKGPRGIKLEDGLIRVEYQFEKPRPVLNINNLNSTNTLHYPPGVRSMWNTSFGGTTGISGSTGDRFSVTASGATMQANVGGVLRGIDVSQNGAAMAQSASASIDKYCADNGIHNKMEMHDGAATMDWMPANDVGITVPGSKSTQRFVSVTMGEMEAEKHSIVLKLMGDLGHNKPVLRPVTVFTKQKCVTCGKNNKAHSKFCVECGTSLEIFA